MGSFPERLSDPLPPFLRLDLLGLSFVIIVFVISPLQKWVINISAKKVVGISNTYPDEKLTTHTVPCQ